MLPYWVCPYCRAVTGGAVPGMSYPSDLTDDQWTLLSPVFKAPGMRGRKHADDLTGCDPFGDDCASRPGRPCLGHVVLH